LTSDLAVRITLVHSPLVGPITWSAVASQLRRGGDQVVVPDLRAAVTARPPYQPAVWNAVAEAIDEMPDDDSLVLVGHSGAGPLLPAIAGACGQPVQALIYVDAGLPRPGRSWFERAPSDLAEHVRELETNGVLPPWDEWFEPDSLAALLPDETTRVRFRRELPKLRLAFLAERSPPVPWAGANGFLLLSESYRPDAEEARAAGWPVLEHVSHHLAMLTEPALIADVLRKLCRLLLPDAGQS